MATPTYDPIASTTLTSSASSVTFSSLDTIAAGYRDLVLVENAISATADYVVFRVNGDTGSNYSMVWMTGNGSSASSNSTSTQTQFYFNLNGARTSGMGIAQIMDFAVTDKHKSVLIRGSHPAVEVDAVAGRWANTSAITSITIFGAIGYNFAAGSTFSLYGIVA